MRAQKVKPRTGLTFWPNLETLVEFFGRAVKVRFLTKKAVCPLFKNSTSVSRVRRQAAENSAALVVKMRPVNLWSWSRKFSWGLYRNDRGGGGIKGAACKNGVLIIFLAKFLAKFDQKWAKMAHFWPLPGHFLKSVGHFFWGCNFLRCSILAVVQEVYFLKKCTFCTALKGERQRGSSDLEIF